MNILIRIVGCILSAAALVFCFILLFEGVVIWWSLHLWYLKLLVSIVTLPLGTLGAFAAIFFAHEMIFG